MQETQIDRMPGILDRSSLRAAQEMGVSRAIDKSGTGASCMPNLKGFPTTKLKLGRSSISTAHEDRRSMAAVTATVHLGNALGMAVIAEAAETREQMESLRSLSMDGIQGYYYAKPMDTEALSVWPKDREHA